MPEVLMFQRVSTGHAAQETVRLFELFGSSRFFFSQSRCSSGLPHEAANLADLLAFMNLTTGSSRLLSCRSRTDNRSMRSECFETSCDFVERKSSKERTSSR